MSVREPLGCDWRDRGRRAPGAAHALRTLLFGVSPSDPVTLAAAVGLGLLMRVAGSIVPVWRAVPQRFQPMRSVYLSLAVPSADEAERIYALLSDDGDIFMAMEETFFAVRFGMLRDKFGTSWMILAAKPQTP